MHEGGNASALIGMVEMQFYVVRAIGHMILSGVFERHPDLVFVVTEITSASEIPAYLFRLDMMLQVVSGEGTPLVEHIGEAVAALKRAPSEYFASNCYIAGPTHDLRPAHDLGTPNLMWGADVPHSEGTSPFTLEALRTMLWDLPEADLNELLATQSRRRLRLRSRPTLQSIADRIGPTVEQIKTELPPEERPRYPGHWTILATVFALRTADR